MPVKIAFPGKVTRVEVYKLKVSVAADVHCSKLERVIQNNKGRLRSNVIALRPMDPHLSEETMMASKFFVVIQTVVLIMGR